MQCTSRKKVFFLAYFDSGENSEQQRSVALSACNKMQSIFNVLKELGYEIEVVSPATTYGMEDAASKKYCTRDGTWVRLFYAIGRKRGILRGLNRIAIRLQAFIYLLGNVKKGEIVLSYHAMPLMLLVTALKRLTGCRLILEIEEIYGDVSGNQKWRKRELRFSKLADAYIFPTQLLDDLVNAEKKPSAIIHGTYEAEENLEVNGNDTIHVVYAGTLDPRKGGAVAAVAAAAELPNNYHVHILGFGSEEQKKKIQQCIDDVQGAGRTNITYDGVLTGEEYVRFLQSCDIGLSTQDPSAQFNCTSFPSKILSYMANGLRVVSVQIDAVKKSAVGNMITYYNEQTPSAIAKAIMSVDLSEPYDSRERIRELKYKFQMDLEEIIKKVKNEDK